MTESALRDEVVEFARAACKPENFTAFGEALARGCLHITSDPHCRGIEIFANVDTRAEYLLAVHWTSVEAHLAFRKSPSFAAYRAEVVALLDGAPSFAHYALRTELRGMAPTGAAT